MARLRNQWAAGPVPSVLRILAEKGTATLTMKSLEDLNREINRALRAANRVAVDVASSSLQDRKAALHEITQALAHIDKLQRMIVAQDPDLEYHFDPDKEPTPTMKSIADLVEAADRHIAEGRQAEAVEILQRACDLEPPPLVYEMIEKRLKGLNAEASPRS